MAGYYGKMPNHGDFVSSGLDPLFIQVWDPWLQDVIAHSKSQLGEAWLDVYLTSPLWRFVLSPSVCTDEAWAGVLMPSVDRVGRYFPLTVVQPLSTAHNPIQVATECRDWFQQLETLALGVLESEFERDILDRDVAALVAPPASTAIDTPLSGDSWRLGVRDAESLAPALDGLTRRLLAAHLGSYSLWWSGGSQRLTPSLLVARGLPPARQFTALFDGQWKHWGWTDHGVFTSLSSSSSTTLLGGCS